MRKKLLLVFSFLSAGYYTLRAQNVQVASTSGIANFAFYNTVKEAFDSINTGYHGGSIAITIAGNTTETATARLDSSGRVNAWGTSSYTDITIRPAGGAWTISGAITAGNPLFDLNGADHVIIDGTGVNITDSLTLVNTTASATAGTSTVRFINDAKNNILRYLTLMGAPTMSTTTNGGIVYFATAATGGDGNDDNEVSGCIFKNSNAVNTSFPYKMIFLNGTTTNSNSANSGIVIRNNQFINFRANGIYSNTGVRDLTVKENHFYHTSVLASSSVVFAPVWISNATAGIGENFNVFGNFIGGSAPNCGGAQPSFTLSGVFQVIYLNCATTALSYINGNTIANMNITSSSSTANHSYIFMNGGKFQCGTQEGNTIGSMTDTSNLVLRYSNSSQTNFTMIATGGATSTPVFDTIWIENNRIGGITHYQQSTAGASVRIFDPAGSTATFLIRYNTIGGIGVTRSIQYYGTGNNMFGLLTRNSGPKLHSFVSNKMSGLYSLSTGTGSAVVGVQTGGSCSWLVDSNTIEYLSSASPNTNTNDAVVVGIKSNMAPAMDVSISGNKISNLIALHPTARTNVLGIDVSGASAGTMNLLSANRIQKLQAYTSAANGQLTGLRLRYANTGQPFQVFNNEIILGIDSLGASLSNACNYNGIYHQSGSGSFLHNSVFVTGINADPASGSYALLCDSGGVCDFQNNVFANDRYYSGLGTERNVAARFNGTLDAGVIPGITVNYNLYYAPYTGSVPVMNNVTEFASLALWRSAAYLYDINSVSGNPNYSSLTELRGSAGSAITTGNTSLNVSYDIENRLRGNFLMGAYDFDGNHPLPVTYIYFTGTAKGTDALLKWATASEINNRGFEIERSFNGNDFESMRFLNGAGNSNKIITYQAVDANIFGKRSAAYYRIKQIDSDGKTAYSQTIFIRSNTRSVAAEAAVYPNPFRDVLHIHNEPGCEHALSGELLDLNGQSIWRESFTELQDDLLIDNLHQVQSGIYFLKLRYPGNIRVIKLSKE